MPAGITTSLFGAVSPPNAIPGCYFWVRSDKGITTGSTFTWADLSGNGYNLTQATSINQPTFNAVDSAYNNYPSLSFASTNSQNLINSSVPMAQPLTMFVVGNFSGASQNQIMIGTSTNQNLYIYNAGANTLISASASSVLQGSIANNGTPFSYVAIFNNTISSIYYNSSIALASGTVGTSGATTGLQIGASDSATFFNGKVVEVAIFSGSLTSGQINQLFLYSNNRYGT